MREIPSISTTNLHHALGYSVPPHTDVIATGDFFDAIVKIPTSSVYEKAYARWKLIMAAKNTLQCTATLGGPLAVGLGNESVTEVGLTLHQTYGVPYIPGSAIKGVCLRAIRKLSDLSEKERENARALFGSTNSAGYLTFYDAWLVPTGEGKNPYQRDTVTVHHPDYYKKTGAFPTDFDDPIPVPFVSVKPGVGFYFAIGIPESDTPEATKQWRTFVEKILHYALTEIGLGGKTNAGYGWFKPWFQEEVQIDSPDTETWENVELERKEGQANRWFVRARLDEEKRAEITQGEWKNLGLADLGKGKRVRGTVKTIQEGGAYKVTEITLL